MKRIFVLRHAQALSTDPGGTDKSRRLSPKGAADAKALGETMAKQGMTPDMVLCSPATRTRETLNGVLEGLKTEIPTEFPENFYNAGANAYLAGVHEVDASVQDLLIIGHNPGIHMLAAQLASDEPSAQAELLSMGYAPATLTVLECDIGDWADLALYENKLMAVLETTEYNAPSRPTRWM